MSDGELGVEMQLALTQDSSHTGGPMCAGAHMETEPCCENNLLCVKMSGENKAKC